MPELPDLEIIAEFLRPRLVGQTVVSAELPRPIVFRDLTGAGLEAILLGKSLSMVWRRGKFLILEFGDDVLLAIHPMLVGRLQYCTPEPHQSGRTYLILGWSNGMELRYVDARGMGKIYLASRLEDVPSMAEMGPDALSDELTLEVFKERLRRHRGEIKGILVNHRFVAGIGNAYADEILFQAGIYPFRKRPALSDEEIESLYHAMRQVLTDAIAVLRERMGDDIPEETRDFLKIHRHGGEPCPHCGTPISEISVRRRITNFCRTCQPGSLIQS